MSAADRALGERVAATCLSFYDKLTGAAKPRQNEWTVFSCFVLEDGDRPLEVVSAGTGSKCLGARETSATGDTLNDSHAEVMARRGLLRYFYEQIEFAADGRDSVFGGVAPPFTLRPGIGFHFYSTRPPCGDASVQSERTTGAKRRLDDGTVAFDFTTVGVVRTKPGKGPPTSSVSCSDKLARWTRVGVQGALLDRLLSEPIKPSSIVVGGDGPCCESALRRILSPESSLVVAAVDVVFPHGQAADKRPSHSSVVWCKVAVAQLETAVRGRKLGVTDKAAAEHPERCLLRISKRSLLVTCTRLLRRFDMDTLHTTYGQLKRKATRYNEEWSKAKKSFSGTWPTKPDVSNFTA